MAAKKSISTRSARDNYGIYTDHELMPNGEARFRLLAQEGGYIRTIASEAGKWQIAHKHKQLIETYVVESGWMGFADLVDDQLRIRVITVGGLVSSQPGESHNVYLPAGAVIHTIKSGDGVERDWDRDDSLTSLTNCLTENALVAAAVSFRQDVPVDNNTKLSSMMDHYQNLDRLIWSVPTFFASGATILVGFFASIATRGIGDKTSPTLLATVFLFAALLFFLSFFSIHRMSKWHAIAAQEIEQLAGYEYFKKRNAKIGKKPWHSAHFVFKSVFAFLSCACATMGVVEILAPQRLNGIIFPARFEVGELPKRERSSAAAEEKASKPSILRSSR